ncbi:YraN family protein [Rhizobium sp. P32RR-XVIII]|uniref:YraN family protein n=1 Tax=Rhizobium sp. P32RR-XVIII TaxID=2726738 RepID=UPI0014569287|nr:YraN family protein [Rhizobium sp. P32RR-XVIII]NLS01980.1 YraN family protein [Rhizobium sp. P32RR-XVIII]
MSDRDITLSRRKAKRRGHVSEYVAALVLMLKGYRIVAFRYRTKLGEIDIIARKRDLAVFVEVKARRDELRAVDAVSYAAQKRIRNASDLWLSRQPDYSRLSQRYDIVAVLPGRLPRHFPDAF